MTWWRIRRQGRLWKPVKGYEGAEIPVVELSRELIRDELLTEGEMRRLGVPEAAAEKVEVPRSRVYRFFGARFEDKEG